MSKYSVTRLNYFISGEKEKIINLDLELPESQFELGLGSENKSQADQFAVCIEGNLVIVKLITPLSSKRDKHNQNRIIKNVTLVANVQESDDILRAYVNTNQFSMKDLTNGEIIHPLYNINDMCLKSNIKKVVDGHQQKNNTEKFVDIYSPQMTENPIHSVKLDDYAYVISETTTDGPLYLRTNLPELRQSVEAGKINDSRYQFKLKSGELNTYLYGSTRYSNLSSNFQNRINLSSVEYNYIFEIPLNASDYNDFPNGDMQAEIFQTKNTYNSLYSMEMPSESRLQHSRQYCGIGVCGDKLFMKYYDNIAYDRLSSAYDESNNISNNIVQEKQWLYSYQKLETIDSINRFKSNIRHKSNLYSISIRNTGLNTTYPTTATNVKIQKLKTDIKNNIREIVKQICPVNTQLFDVYFDGV